MAPASHSVSGTPHIAVLQVRVDSQPRPRPRARALFHAPSIAPRSAADTVAAVSVHVLPVGNAVGTAGTPSDAFHFQDRENPDGQVPSARSPSYMRDTGTCQRHPFYTG